MADEYNRLAQFSAPAGPQVNHLMQPPLPAGHPSNMLMAVRDWIPQVQADDTSTASGIYSRIGRTATAIPRAGLETMANWLRGVHDSSAVRIGEDTIAPLGLAGFGMAMVPKNAVGMFGGRLAQTADQSALAKAEQMAASGAPREAIWKDTGWFQGVDGKWRFEIDDSGVAKTFDGVPPSLAPGPAETTLGKALGDQNIRDAYPSVDDVLYTSRWASNKMAPIGEQSTALAGGYGSIGHNQRPAVAMQHELLGSSTKDSAASRSLHEAQHYLQDVEGFARGGVPSRSDPAVLEAWRGDARKWWEWAKKGWDDPERRALGRDYMQRLNAGEDVSKHPYANLARLNEEYGVTFAPDAKFPKNYMPAYRRLAGEVEARAVEARRHMTADERRARPPWLDYDTPEASQIVRGAMADNAKSSVPGTIVNSMGEGSRGTSPTAGRPSDVLSPNQPQGVPQYGQPGQMPASSQGPQGPGGHSSMPRDPSSGAFDASAIRRAYETGSELPDGWYVHGRHGQEALRDDAVIQATRSYDTMVQYAGKDGSGWAIRPKDSAKVLDLTADSPEIRKLAQQMMADYRAGRLPHDMDQMLPAKPTVADFHKAALEFSPSRIVESAGAFDSVPMVNWLYDRRSPDFVRTPDGAVAMHPDALDKVRLFADNAKSSVPGTVVNAMGEQRPSPAYPFVQKHKGNLEKARADVQEKLQIFASDPSRRAHLEQALADLQNAKSAADIPSTSNFFPQSMEVAPRTKASHAESGKVIDDYQLPSRSGGEATTPGSDFFPSSMGVKPRRGGGEVLADNASASSPGAAANSTQQPQDNGIGDFLHRNFVDATVPLSSDQNEWAQEMMGNAERDHAERQHIARERALKVGRGVKWYLDAFEENRPGTLLQKFFEKHGTAGPIEPVRHDRFDYTDPSKIDNGVTDILRRYGLIDQ